MAVLVIGQTSIPYEVRYSERARRKRIVVTAAAGVGVVAPVGTPEDDVVGYVHAKRRWIFDSVNEVAEQHRRVVTERWASGAKVEFHGRALMLDVNPGDVPRVQIRMRSKFHVVAPTALDGAAGGEAIAAAFEVWLRDRAETDMLRVGRDYEAVLGVTATAYRLSDAKARWGSCGRDGVVSVHWRLVQAPVTAFEYVVAHELVHLTHRNHSPAFWSALTRVMPDWKERKAGLERWEGERRGV